MSKTLDELADIFDACQKSVGVALTTGSISDDQSKEVDNAHKEIRSFIHLLAVAENNDYEQFVQPALEDVHPGKEYSRDMILRDLADVCHALFRVREGKMRSERIKFAEAILFLQHLRDELRAQ